MVDSECLLISRGRAEDVEEAVYLAAVITLQSDIKEIQ